MTVIGRTPYSPAPVPPLTTLPDGTIKQVNPFSGTEVWTVPGRARQPVPTPPGDVHDVDDAHRDAVDQFGLDRMLETPPEKARLVIDSDGRPRVLRGVPVGELRATTPLFRRVANLHEILTYDYWRVNYGYRMNPAAARHMAEYLADPAGQDHVEQVLRARMASSGTPAGEIDGLFDGEHRHQTLHDRGAALFAGGHDVIIARDHYVPGATRSDELAGSGTLSWADHRLFMSFTVDGMDQLYRANRYVRYVAAFQNWLEPAGAGIEHLHKQLVAIDEHGLQNEVEIAQVRANPNMYNEWAVDYAMRNNLVFAENDHAVAFAGFGHRYPTLEVFSRSATTEPWLMTDEERDAVSDLVHACHIAAGPHIPSNEEWLHRPLDVDVPMPWRIVIKWRVSTMAGFEGGTKIYLNTVSPGDLKTRVLAELEARRDRLAPGVRLGDECEVPRNSLRYNPAIR
ncbi:DUF4921 family protein [Corynebacterium bovis]|uniref:DUF4921 domain-containing protein n=2 Tax=Corynebacterium bovis TaxID=36808 RepID=A0A3R8VXZ4_9CORY|nr:DUF4921 family protein [Corynebacterium bovis]QQC47925.1 DUF4921 family protein [Corynebacterium bovis]RRO84252.1 DUF4921 domain-containing protein [Corynebacterium bovis]RRO85067.1 DUF4921 domain-containing protein [Corynebacterium bovis]RRO92867.1 DUF4921 domain-containing protein [Corynebacterium bovis]RRO96985.1 DUF4921 domain-containing protein [Corynebacterium bovis]